MSKRAATVRVARWSATHPWRAIALWMAFVVACFALGQLAGNKDATMVDLGVGESGRATTMVHEAGLDKPAHENVVITSKSGALDKGAAQVVAGELAGRMHALPQVSSVDRPITSKDGTALLLPVIMKGDPDTAGDRVEPLLKATAAVAHEHSALRLNQVGDASIDKGINDQVTNDLGKSETLSLPVTLVIMLVAFGAIVAAGVPILLALSAIASSMGLSSIMTHFVPNNGSANNIIMLMGMAVGVDYSLFYLKREREERRRGRGKVDAIEVAAATSGHSVVVSAMAVILSMAGLYLAEDGIFNSIATAGVIVVAVAMLGSLTVLPALLAKLGRAVDRPRVPILWRLTADREGGPRMWPKLLRPALNHPARTLGVSVIALVLLAIPALNMNLRNSGADTLPRSIPVVASYDAMVKHFPSKGSTYEIAVHGEKAAIAPQLVTLEGRIADSRYFAHDQAPEIRTSTDGRTTSITVATPYEANSENAKNGLNQLRDDILPSTVGTVAGEQDAVGGDVADGFDYSQHQADRLPWVIGFVLAMTFLMMAFTFRSIVVALTAITINLLSAAAAFGVLVGVFQYSWAESLLKFHSNGSVVNWIPLFLFAVLFGLSMDYHVFVVSRIREAVERGMSTKDAVEQGITRSAGVVTSAAFVMISVFAVFATLSMMEMKQLGLGLAAAVLIDAMIVRIVVLPSLMVLLGRANWWPGRLSRKHRAPVAADAERILEPVGR